VLLALSWLLKLNAILNALGNAMTHTVLLFVTQYVSLPNVIPHVPNQRTLFAMSNAKNPNVKLNAQIKDVKCLTAPNVLLSVKLLTALPTAKLLNQNVKLYVKNQNVTGNATNPTVLNLNVN
jgi:hypothetical protein